MRVKNIATLIQSLPSGTWAIPAFNVFNMEFVQAVVGAAEDERSPVILMLGDPVLPFCGVDMIIDICESVIAGATVPVCIALDHGKTEAHLIRCVEREAAIMYDGSDHEFETNIAETRRWLEIAHRHGLSLEAELGSFGAEFDDSVSPESRMTTVDDCARFISAVPVDLLAVGVGNYHGKYKGEPHIDVARLREIAAAVPSTPLVLHGASGIPADTIHQCLEAGVKKVNFGYDLKFAYADALREELNREPMPTQPPAFLAPARDAVRRVARDRIRDVLSSGLIG